eukprot:GHVU01217859.1.p1 GENE.GHVU01217859.1~~GHVU01217859.1.p1  ORF type:complete len:341 (+),score=63.49 GHVU01217859.1:662-1684(+)
MSDAPASDAPAPAAPETPPADGEAAVRAPANGGERRRKLGRGLNALLGEMRQEQPVSPQDGASGESDGSQGNARLLSVAVAAIEPLPGQPRTRFDDERLDELAASIKARGVIQPIIVRALDNGRYQLVAGERRWRAAQRAQLHEIPAVVRQLDRSEIMALALIENLQREDLNPMEEARAYHRLAEDEGLTQAEIATMVDKSRSHVANLQRLIQLPAAVQEAVAGGTLSMGHARALIGHPEAGLLARRAVDEQLSVRQVEQLVRRASGRASAEAGRAAPRRSRNPANDADLAAVQGHLEEFLGLMVRIKAEADPHKGTVTIRYRTLDQLDLICQRLTGGDL